MVRLNSKIPLFYNILKGMQARGSHNGTANNNVAMLVLIITSELTFSEQAERNKARLKN